MKQPKHKFSTPHNPKPFVVGEKKGKMVTAGNGSQTATSHSSHFKVIPRHFAQCQENGVKKDYQTTPGIQQNPSETKEESLPRRSKRHIKPPARFSDYVQVSHL